MDAKELRIGNWYLKNEGGVLIEKQITIEDFAKLHSLDGLILNGYSYAPLTEEWFSKWGYEHPQEALAHHYDLMYDHLGVVFDLQTESWYKAIMNMSVHQFQNFWKVNTGEELTIKETV